MKLTPKIVALIGMIVALLMVAALITLLVMD
jgi:preprotein translocase subunit Sec61beta